MIDLSKVKPNAVVKFRDGSITQIRRVDLSPHLSTYTAFVLWNDGGVDPYTMTGRYDSDIYCDEMDIVDFANIPEGANVMEVIAYGSRYWPLSGE